MTALTARAASRAARAAWLAAVLAASAAADARAAGAPVALDHVPVAVRDLERAVADYRALGFAIKPGRPHPNGIRNAHVKLPDGGGIELITAGAAVDALTAHYRRLLAAGEGPAYLALRAPDGDALAAVLRGGGWAIARDGEVTEVRQAGLEFVYFVRDNRSPTDRPEHFAHGNGATALAAAWVATDADAELVRLLTALGGTPARRVARVPDPAAATVVTLGGGEVAVLPAGRQLLPGRPVVGVALTVRDLDVAARAVEAAGVAVRRDAGPPRRIVLPPGVTHGLWLELRESR